MSNYDLIKKAILEKKIVTAEYNGYYREMCPHLLGRKNNTPQALFYQFGGDSSSGLSSDERKNWRCIPVDNLENIELKTGQWHTASNHSRPSTCVDIIDVEVVY